MFGLEEGFVALDVDVDVGGDLAGDGFDSIGAAGEVGRGDEAGPAVGLAQVGDFGGVGGDDDLVKAGAASGGVVDPGEHGFAGDFAEDFPGETGGGEAGGDDAEDACGVLFDGGSIRYDEACLCHGDGFLFRRLDFCRQDAIDTWRCSSDG